MNDVMIDLETLGTHAGCVILSIGAAMFDPHGDGHGSTFYVNIDRENAKTSGLRVEPETEAWWAKQSQAVKDALLVDPQPVVFALASFDAWFKGNGAKTIWCHGANFDEPILSYCFWRLQQETPWKFWDVRCTRTLYDISGVDPRKMHRTGAKHNALDDAKTQIACVQASLRRLKGLPDPQPRTIDPGVFA